MESSTAKPDKVQKSTLVRLLLHFNEMQKLAGSYKQQGRATQHTQGSRMYIYTSRAVLTYLKFGNFTEKFPATNLIPLTAFLLRNNLQMNQMIIIMMTEHVHVHVYNVHVFVHDYNMVCSSSTKYMQIQTAPVNFVLHTVYVALLSTLIQTLIVSTNV